jgi:hypothetical protein
MFFVSDHIRVILNVARLISYRYCHSYEGENLEIVIPPVLKEGEKIHYMLFQDESCMHANDQSMYIWQEEGVQPLRSKDRGRLNHCSDIIIEHCGRLVLTPEEVAEQMKLPEQPKPPPAEPQPIPQPNPPPANGTRRPRKNANKETPGRWTLERSDGWIPPPPPTPFKSYRLPSFDACRIIYPGANHDPWWDMKQLIAQVIDRLLTLYHITYMFSRSKMPSKSLSINTLMVLVFSSLTVLRLMNPLPKMHF